MTGARPHIHPSTLAALRQVGVNSSLKQQPLRQTTAVELTVTGSRTFALSDHCFVAWVGAENFESVMPVVAKFGQGWTLFSMKSTPHSK